MHKTSVAKNPLTKNFFLKKKTQFISSEFCLIFASKGKYISLKIYTPWSISYL